MEKSTDSLNPWGNPSGLGETGISGHNGASIDSSGRSLSASSANGPGAMGSMSRATAKKHPLATTPSPRSSHLPGSSTSSEDAQSPAEEQAYELTPETSVVVHAVKPTDTLSSIALRYGTDVNTMLRANRMWPGDAVQMRAEIFIPLLNCKRTPPDTVIRAKAAIANSAALSGSRSPSASGTSPSVLSSREGPGAESLPSATASTATAGGIIIPLAPGFNKPTVHSHSKAASSVAGSSSASRQDHSGREGDRDWKPNKWTLGSASSSSATGGSRSSVSASEGTSYTASSGGHTESSSRRELPSRTSSASGVTDRGEENERASTGWNDAPAPNARVARAYQGGTRRTGHHRLLQDLAAGLPPNTGAAANWQRPINDSLPVPQNPALGPPRRDGRRTGSQSGTSRPSNATIGPGISLRAPSPGLGKIFSDAFRGRMSVEDAFEAAVQSVSSSISSPPTESSPAWTNTLRPPDGRYPGPSGVRALSPQPRPPGERHYETVSPFGSLRGASGNGLSGSGSASGGAGGHGSGNSRSSPPGHELNKLSFTFEESSIQAEKWEREQARLAKSGGGPEGSDRLHPSTARTGQSSGLAGIAAARGSTVNRAGGSGSGLRARGSVRNFDWANGSNASSARTSQ
ncbi:hypothetical protein V8E36_000398 [Tilletia maclaganii]